MGHLLDALEHAYRALGLQDAAGGDEVFGQLVPARVIESASRLASLRVLEEAGVSAPSYQAACAACRPLRRIPGASGRRPRPWCR